MATATSLITAIRYRLQDTDDTAYPNAMLLSFMNDGCREFALTTGCCQDTATITPDGSNSYVALDTTNLTYRVLNVYAATFSNAHLYPAPRYEASKWNPSAGTPTAWSVWGEAGAERMYFDTIPPATSSALKIWFTYVPTELSAVGSTVGIPEKFHSAIVSYVCYRVHDSNRETGLADRLYAEYDIVRQTARAINEALLGGGYS